MIVLAAPGAELACREHEWNNRTGGGCFSYSTRPSIPSRTSLCSRVRQTMRGEAQVLALDGWAYGVPVELVHQPCGNSIKPEFICRAANSGGPVI
jgi:hypothetical protein